MNMKKRLLSLLLALTLLCSLALPALAVEDPYAGIVPGAWYESAAKLAVDNGVMTGTDTGFAPDGAVTRGQIYQIVYNLAGQPTEGLEHSAFSDLTGAWYSAAANWAVGAKLLTVPADKLFGGSETVTRAEVAQVIANYARYDGATADVGAASGVEKAPDYADIPAAYLDGVTFCYASGVMVGNDSGMLNPNAKLTRAELAQIMANFDQVTYAFTETTLTIPNGEREIPAIITIPAGAGPFPAVVMNHGHGGNKDEGTGFVGIAQTLALQGVATIRMDFPGCGDSEAPFTDECQTNRISDSNACKDYLLENYPVDANRLGIFGLSMGGRTAALIVGTKDSPYKAMALLAGAVGDGQALAEGMAGGKDKYAAAYETAKTEGKFTITTQYGQVQDLSTTWFDDTIAMKPLENAKNFTGPVLVVYGDKDVVVPADVNALSLKAYPQAVELVVKDADHSYGFYAEQPQVSGVVVEGISSFFAVNLCGKVSSDTFLAAPGMADWFATGKTAYTIQGMTVSKETAVHNDLEDADYTAQPGTDVVLTGTAEEQWVTPLEKVLKTYTKADGSALTAEDFKADAAVALTAIPGTGNFACFVPKAIQVEVQTAWGDVLQANRDGVPHGDGDYLVCSAGKDGKPDLTDVWVVNGEIFAKTYQTK